LSFDNATGGLLVDFPILVRLDPSRIDYARVAPDALDLRFIDSNGQDALPHEIERWVPGGESLVWVRVPMIDAASTTDFIYLSYGSEMPAMQDPPGVWSAGYAAVWHLGQEGAGAVLLNSAANGYPGTPVGTSAVPGRIGGGRAFHDSGDERVTVDGGEELFSGWPQFTIEAWVYPDYPSDSAWENAGEDFFLDKGGPIGLGRVRRIGTQLAGRGTAQIDANFTSASVFATVEVERRAWTWIVFTLNEGRYRVYRNGAQVSDQPMTAALQSGSNPFYLGHDGNAMNGILDEVRLADVGRDEGWVEAQHRSMQDSFVTFGAEERP